jgi:hypothetical protein
LGNVKCLVQWYAEHCTRDIGRLVRLVA